MLSFQTVGLTQMLYGLHRIEESLKDLRPELEEASKIVYEHTRQRFESSGDGTWPPLAESTVARKESQGYAEPMRILYAEGNLFESVTSPNGPYSNVVWNTGVMASGGKQFVVLQADWGDTPQVPTILAEGNSEGNLPARPIWPSAEDPILREEVHAVFVRGVHR